MLASCSSSNVPETLLPQGLCLGCSLCLEHSSCRDPRGSLFQVFAEIPPSHGGLPLAAGSARQPPTLLSRCPTQQFPTLSTRWLFPLPFASHLLPPTNSGLFRLWPATVCLVLRAVLAHPVLKNISWQLEEPGRCSLAHSLAHGSRWQIGHCLPA